MCCSLLKFAKMDENQNEMETEAKTKSSDCRRALEKNINKKREDYLQWNDFFMATAMLVAKRSKDPVSQVGACIVNSENKIVGTGYNGMPIGCSDDVFPWNKTSDNPLESKYFYVCHAEMNAVLNKNSADVKNCRIYVGLFPCNECAKIIIQSGIREVIYLSDKHSHKPETIAAKHMFDSSGVRYWQYIPRNEKLVIDFNEINWSTQRQVPSTPDSKGLHKTVQSIRKVPAFNLE